MRIGIFGGSFNPPHNMHKQIAVNLIRNNYIDKVIYVPTGNKYNKNNLIDAKYRLEMLKLMIKDEDSLDVSDYEVKNILTYTYQTLDYFKKIYPDDEIYFICGSDNLKEITTWKEYEYILSNFKLIVIKRNNDNINEIINNLNKQNIVVAEIPFNNISSTLIRKNIKEKSKKFTLQIDEKVLNYIKKESLY